MRHWQLYYYDSSKIHLPSTSSAHLDSPPLKVLTPTKSYKRRDIMSTPSRVAPVERTPTTPVTPRTQHFLDETCEMSSSDTKERGAKRQLHFNKSDTITPKRRKILKLQHTLTQQSKSLRNKRSQISRLKSKIITKELRSEMVRVIYRFQYPSPEAKAIVKKS